MPTDKESASLGESSRKVDAVISVLDEKLRKLTRHLLDEIIDEDMYRVSKEELLVEKTALIQEKNRLKKKRCNYWIEPALTLVSTLETLGQMADAASPQKIANDLRKIGTNPFLSNKTVTFSFAENYDFIPSLLASARSASPVSASKRCGDFDQSFKWCSWQESNLHFSLRRGVSYPLNDKSIYMPTQLP